MWLTFLDLWKQRQGANQNLILNKGKGVTTGHQSPFHAVSMMEPSACSAAEHSGALRTCQGHSSKWHQRWRDGIHEFEALHHAGVPFTQDGPQTQPDLVPGLQLHAGPATTRQGHDAWFLGQSVGPSCPALPRVTTAQNHGFWQWGQMKAMGSDHWVLRST